MRATFKILTICLLSIFTPSCSQNISFNDYKKSFIADFKKELTENHVANASFAVFNKDSIILQDETGNDNLKPMGQNPFLIGSITKVFTAVAIMQLNEKGMIDIDKPVSDYVPDFKIKQRFPDSAPITIRAVLTHHAGIPSDDYLHKFSKKSHNFNEILTYLNSQSTCYPVNKIRAYSNLGYALLGILIERVSGLTYEQYMNQHIFTPLNMSESGLYNDYQHQKDMFVAHNNQLDKKTELPIIDQPAGAIYSTVDDMIKFCRSFINGRETLLKTKTIEQMFALQNHDNLLDMDFRSAICFNFKNKAGELGRIFEHGSATMFHRAQIVIAPDAGLAAVVLTDSPNGKENAWKLDEQFMTAYCNFTHTKPIKSNNPEKLIRFTPISSKKLSEFAGKYAMPGMVCTFYWKHQHLSPTINGENFYLAQEDSNSFVPAKRFMGILFKSRKMYFLVEEIDKEKHFIQAMAWGGLTIIGTKTPIQNINKIWKQRMGNYIITNSDPEDAPTIQYISIAEECGFLVLKYSFNQDMAFGQNATMALDMKNDNEAFILGYGRGGGESVIFDDNSESFSFFGLKFRKK